MMTDAAPAQPTAILRGHRGQVNASAFVRLSGGSAPALTADSRLATADSEGFVVLWDLAIVRPRAVWRAHTGSILGIAGWDADGQIATHGRDHKIVVWQVGVADEARLSTALPLDGSGVTAADTPEHPKPWIVHVLDVNAMNFCAFAWCGFAGSTAQTPDKLIAVPNTLTLEAVDIFHLPSQRRINTIKLGDGEGMIMALALFYTRSPQHAPTTLVLVAAFENGVALVATLDGTRADGPATIVYRAQPHSQPVLSFDVAPDQSYFVTSSADAVLARHPIPLPIAKPPVVTTQPVPDPGPRPPPGKTSLLSAALAREPPAATPLPSVPEPRPVEVKTQPLAVVDTKHAGQQGLRIRSDGRVFATAGWDGRVRVYSAKTLKEVAVLKWHQQGCFTVAFAPVPKAVSADDAPSSTAVATTTPAREVSVKARRLQRAVTAHWLAAGSKDAKTSLWDIF